MLSLQSNDISITANFFEVGGNSLLAVRLTTIVKEKFNLQNELIGVREVFNFPVLKDMSDKIGLAILVENNIETKTMLENAEFIEEGEI